MNSPFEKLNKEEREELYLIPVWVSILIAGADNVFSKREIKKAMRLAWEKTKDSNSFLTEFYESVASKFEVNLKGYMSLMPRDDNERSDFLIKRLTRVNDLLKKVDLEYAQQLYLSFRDFAYRVAHASGGLFGLLSISFAESKFIDLKMIKDPADSQN
jgi:hypothetical protein